MRLRPALRRRRAAMLGGVAVLLVGVLAGAGIAWSPWTHSRSAAEPLHPSASADVAAHRDPQWFRLESTAGQPFVPNAENYAARTRTSGPLLLFLPATGKKPGDYDRFLRLATSAGYHVLGLDYWNKGKSVASTCKDNPTCYGQVQRNRFDGSHPVSVSHVDADNSILNRLRAALTYLKKDDPTGGWGRYLSGSDVRWSDVVVAGHSQGGGESAYISHIRSVRGVLTFGAPIITGKGVVAAWTKTPGRTPTSRIYSFDNSSDVFYPRIAASWKALHLGTPQNIANRTTFSSHALLSTRVMAHAHDRVLADTTPLNAKSVPIYQPAWTWMLDRFI